MLLDKCKLNKKILSSPDPFPFPFPLEDIFQFPRYRTSYPEELNLRPKKLLYDVLKCSKELQA